MGAPHGCVLVVAELVHGCGGKVAPMAQPGMLFLLTMYGCPDGSSLLPASCLWYLKVASLCVHRDSQRQVC